jgi:hypothetical protein
VQKVFIGRGLKVNRASAADFFTSRQNLNGFGTTHIEKRE